jgi:hypothetical protein
MSSCPPQRRVHMTHRTYIPLGPALQRTRSPVCQEPGTVLLTDDSRQVTCPHCALAMDECAVTPSGAGQV